MRDGLADPAVRRQLDEIVRVYGPVAQQLKGG
jgi:hypothetical protein